MVVQTRTRLPTMAEPHTWVGVLSGCLSRLYTWHAHCIYAGTFTSPFHSLPRFHLLLAYVCPSKLENGPRATVRILRRSIFSTVIHFSIRFISIDRQSWTKTRMRTSASSEGRDGIVNDGGTN